MDSVLLKGPAFDQLLFEGRRSRAYLDIDVLADPAHIPAAERLLEQLGFRRAERRSATRAARRAGMSVGVLRAPHATAWIRHCDRFTLDLHHTLPQIGVSAREAWRALGAHRGTITVVGTHVETLDQPASALLIALHAAHHGPSWNRAQIDLRRACEVLGFDTWHAAALLAGQLRTRTAMGIGLGTVTEGRALARELGLRTRPTWAHRVMWSGIAWRERGRRAG